MARQATIANLPKTRGMDFERIGTQLALIALLLVVTLAAAVVLLVALGGLDPGAFEVAGWNILQRPLGWVAAAQETDRYYIIAPIAFLVALLSAMLLVGRLRGGSSGARRGAHPSRYVLLADERGFVLVETGSILVVARQAALHAPGAVDAQISIRGAASAPIRLRVDLSVHPGADVKGAGGQARDAVHDAVERLVGVEVADVTVDVRVLDADELARVLL